MDKKEKNIRYEEIMSLIADHEFEKAAYIADGIDWRRENYKVLMNISSLYRLCGRPDDALELMLSAYDKKPRNKRVVYGLCDLYLERKDTVNASSFYNIYKKMDPDTPEEMILNCRLIELVGGSIASQIEVLEKLKNTSPTHPEWRYQLAYLYHRVGAVKECVDTCDDIFIWFQNGPFVVKALELKMLHKRLTPEQQYVYDRRDEVEEELNAYESDTYSLESYDSGMEPDPEIEGIEVKLIDQDKFNTINLSRELARSMAELLAGEEDNEKKKAEKKEKRKEDEYYDEEDSYEDEASYDEEEYYDDEEPLDEEEYYDEEEPLDEEEYYDEEGSYEDGEEYYDEEGSYEDGEEYYDEEDVPYEDGEEYEDEYYDEEGSYEEDSYEDEEYAGDDPAKDGEAYEDEVYDDELPEDTYDGDPGNDTDVSEEDDLEKEDVKTKESETFFSDKTEELVIDVPPAGANPAYKGVAATAAGIRKVRTIKSGRSAGIFDEGYDGQLTMPIPPEDKVEKQITGQMTLDEELENWEDYRQRKDEELRRGIEKQIKDTTGPIFADFEKKTKESRSRHADVEEVIVPEKLFKDKYTTEGVDIVPAENENAALVDQDTHGTTIWKEVDALIAEQEAMKAAKEEAAENEAAKEEAVSEEETAETEEIKETEETKETEAAENEDSEEEAESDTEAETEDDAETAETAETAEEEDGEAEEEGSEEDEYDDPALNTDQMEMIADALETDADRLERQTAVEYDDDYELSEEDEADFSEEELDIFAPFLYSRKMKDQILFAIEEITLAAYVGNVIITGDEKRETRALARAILEEIQLIDSNFDEKKIARVSGEKMNSKDVAAVCSKLENGALVIEGAYDLTRETLEKLTAVLESSSTGIIVILIDDRASMDEVISDYDLLTGYFNARIDMLPLTDSALVDHAMDYAFDKEYMIDSARGVLALHQRIDELQIGEHNVTLAEVEGIVDEAIERSRRRPVSSFFEILSGKRYDNEYDMVVLKEKDFQR